MSEVPVIQELLPCPFCGSKRTRQVESPGGGGYPAMAWVECDSMTCGARGKRFSTTQIYETRGIVSAASTAWNTRHAHSARLAAIEECAEEIRQLKRKVADRSYMLEAMAQMLGPNGRTVWQAWQKAGVERVHYAWNDEAASLTGEDRARIILDAEAALEHATPLDFDDATAIRALKEPNAGGGR